VRDAEGRPLAGRHYAGRLATVSPVPVYGTFASHLASGSLGGAINDFTEIGRAAATAVAQVLSGNAQPGPLVVEPPPAPLRVNWRALEQWRIPTARVPGDAQILFREPGLWERYRHLVVAVLAVLLLQGLLISGLLLQLRRRRRAEAAQTESEERLRLAAEAAQIGMWGWDASHEMWATASCRALHGLALDGAISFRAFTEVLNPEDRDRLRASVQAALLEKRAFAEEYRVTPPEAGMRWIATRGCGFYGDKVDPLRVLGVCVDITERKRSEEALRLALEALPTAILMVNQQGTIVLSNAQAQKLLGYGAVELAGQPIEILVPERFREGHAGYRASFFAAPATRPMGVGRTIFARRKNGTEIPIEIGLNPVAAGDQRLVLAAMIDLTERQELVRRQTELEHITRVSTLGELAPSLAHELSQPLSAILSNAQAGLRLLDRGTLDAAEMRDILEDVVAADKRAGDVIGVLRVLMRRGKTEQVRVDVAQAVREILGVLHGELLHEKVEVGTALDGQCVALASRTQLEQVLLNLITNAIDAMRPQPPSERRLRVTVSLSAEGGTRVAIRDSGIGIPTDELGHVFEAFRTTKPLGMGMGLAVCRSIISSLGGDIQIEPNEGGGVTVAFTLPAAPPT
jgi:two-component system sensor kinase FixL